MDDDTPDLAALVRLARCAAARYRAVPREGAGIQVSADEIAHAGALDVFADELESGEEQGPDTVLRPSDIRAVCRLLIDVRRNPRSVSAAEARVAREHFPEVEADSLDPLEALIAGYTALLRP